MRNIIFVISGPSGVGKGTVVSELLPREENLTLSVSCTTRAPRAGEVDGKNYFFITKEEFEDKEKNGEFLEFDEHFSCSYATPKAFVEERLKTKSVLLEIDVKGAKSVKSVRPDAVTVFLAPPSEAELKNRLTGRNTESEEQIRERLSRLDYELGEAKTFDYVVVNDDLQETVETVLKIFHDERNKA